MAGFISILPALLGGILPALVWLAFWLSEDRDSPEPRTLLAATFLAGAAAVVPTYLIQELFRAAFNLNIETQLAPTLLVWAASEELIKYLAVALVAFRSRYFDEPIDAMIYLITGALGFAAAENSLFMFNILNGGGSELHLWLNGNFRFIGATVVHVVASSILGAFIASAYCEHRYRRAMALLGGLVTATWLHALFNYLILESAGTNILKISILFWTLAVVVIYLFERIKTIVCRWPIKT